MIIIFSYLLSIIPSLAIFFWFRSMKKDDSAYRTLCSHALRDGILCFFAVLLVSIAFNILEFVILRDNHPVLREVTHAFIVLAFSEELVKFLTFKRLMKKHDYAYSWLDMTILMMTVGMGFGIIENVVVALTSGPGIMFIRGIMVAHGGYNFMMGWFLGKAEKTGKKLYARIGFVLPWLLHGAYDCGLSEKLYALNENIAVVPVSLALLSLITLVVAIIFFIRAGKNEIYTQPLHAFESSPDESSPENSIPDESSLETSSPDESSLESSIPDESSPENSIPENVTD